MGSIIQNDEKIDSDVNHRTPPPPGWPVKMKRNRSFMQLNILLRLKESFYQLQLGQRYYIAWNV